MNPSPTPEVKKIQHLVARLDSGAALESSEYKEMLEVFERYDCWGPYFRLIKRNLSNHKTRSAADFISLTRIQNIYLEDLFAAAETFALMVTTMKLSYIQIRDEVLPHVIEHEDFTAEATLLQSSWSQFRDKQDQVQCLERLCMLYEKKTHNETQLADTYQTLRSVDPKNVKALRYFKMVHTQNNEWAEVVGTLQTLLASVKHQQELYRVAQELAAIYLYQLDRAKEAIQTLEQHCTESPLDTSTILFDAYQRLGDWPGCLRVLRQALLAVDGDSERAVLHHRIAQISEQIRDFDQAFDNYVRAAELWPVFFDPIEGLITIALAKKDWNTVRTWLNRLVERTKNEELDSQLKQALQRLEDGLCHAQSE